MKDLPQTFPLSKTALLVLLLATLASAEGRAQTVLAWGDNSQGQTNVPPTATNVVAVAGGRYHSLALRADGTLVGWGGGTNTVPPDGITNATAIVAGNFHSAALLADGTVTNWGDNTYGQLNVPATVTNVVALAAGSYFTLALRADGTVVGWGRRFGFTPSIEPTNVPPSVTNVVAIAAGQFHALALRQDGSTVIWGGAGLAYSRVLLPMPPLITNVLALAAGQYQNVALVAGGTIGQWGNKYPLPPTSATNVVAIASGTNYNLVLTADGRVLSWASNSVMAVPGFVTNAVAIAAGFQHSLAVVSTNTAPQILGPTAYQNQAYAGSPLPLYVRAIGSQPLHYQWLANGTPIPGTDSPFPQIPATLGADTVQYQVIVSNTVGAVTSLVAQVKIFPVNAWGDTLVGQCNVPPTVTNPVAVAAGALHALALSPDGTVTAWGKNVDGQATVPSVATNIVAIAAGGDHSLTLRTDGSVLAWGRNWDGQTNVPPTATNVVAISAGWAHSLALRADGTVVAWGNDDYGQTDVSFLATDLIAISAGYYHNIALRADGRVITWGWDVPLPLSATNVIAVAAGWEHCLALRSDGTVIAWGDNTYGECNVPATATNVVAIAAGFFHNVALRSDGTVVAWGKAALGVTAVPAGLQNVAAIAAGEAYSLALVASGPPQFGPQLTGITGFLGGQATLRAVIRGGQPLAFQWFHDGLAVGGATNATLVITNLQTDNAGNYTLLAISAQGQTATQPVTLTVQAPATTTIAGGWGGSYWGQCAVAHAITTPRAISAGAFHALALNADGTVAAWGKNSDGQTNIPPQVTSAVAIAAGGNHSLALMAGGAVLGWGRNWDGQTNVPAAASNIVAIAAGAAHSLALRADGTVLAWGNDDYGQTDVGLLPQDISCIAAGYYHSLFLRSNHTVMAVGLLSSVPSSATNVVAISAGWWHSLALRADGSVLAWGDNSFGQCAVPPSATNVVAVAAGFYHSLALRADGTVVAWGKGYNGVTNVPAGLFNVSSISAGEDYSLAIVELGPPRFNTQLGSVPSHLGANAIFTGDPRGTQPLALQWFHDGQPLQGANNCSLTLTDVRTNDAGTYTLQLVNGVGQTNGESASLSVDTTPAVQGMAAPQNVLLGTAFCLPATVSGSQPLSFQWQLNGVNLADGGHISGATSPTLCFSNAQYSDSGSYSLIASNAVSVVTGFVAQVSVTPVIAWGDNSAGQLVVPASASNIVAISTSGDHNLALRADSTLIGWGDNTWAQNNWPQSNNIVAISDGEDHSLAVRTDGTVMAWGSTNFGQINVPANANNVVAVAAGGVQSLALKRDGSVLVWGDASQKSVPASATNLVAIAAGHFWSMALRADGVVIPWGGMAAPPPAATNIVAIAAGANHALALRADSNVFAWGNNCYGQCSVPAFVTNAVAIGAGGDLSLALLADGTLSAWGANDAGQDLPPLSAANAGAFVAGGSHALALPGVGSVPQGFQQTANLGQAVMLFAPPLANGNATYQWQLNGINLAGATSASLRLGSFSYTNTGTYRVVVSNSFGTTLGPATTLSVLRPSNQPLMLDPSTFVVSMATSNVQVRVLGPLGLGFIVLYAGTDLVHWTVISSSGPTTSPVLFSGHYLGSGNKQFYRAAEIISRTNLVISPGLAPGQSGPGAFPLRVRGLSGLGPVIFSASSNLVDWQPVFTNPPALGSLQYLDTTPTPQPVRFYRVSETR